MKKIHKYVKIKQHTYKQPIGQKYTKRMFIKYLETKKNRNTIQQNFRDAAKVVLGGKFTAKIPKLIKKKDIK